MSHSIRIVSPRSLRSYLKTLGVFAVLMFCALFAAGASAQNFDLNTIKKAPHFTTLTDAQFAAQSTLATESPPSDKSLAFSISLPKGWVKASSDKLVDAPTETSVGSDAGAPPKGEVSHHILGMLARYDSPPNFDAQSRMEISALQLDFDISARNWFLNYIITNGYALQGLDEIDKTRLEALYVLVEGDQSYIVRTVAQINGSRIVLVSYYLPEQHWNQEKAVQEKVIGSFKFTNPDKTRVETAHTYAFLDLLHIDYPNSWSLESPDVESAEDMSVQLVDTRDKAAPVSIDVHILATDADKTLAQQVKTLRDNLGKVNIVVGNLIEQPSDFKLQKQVYFSKIEVYDAHGTQNQYLPQEFWLAVMTEDRYYYIVSMLTPSRTASFLAWARNTESFRTICESIRP